MNSKTTNNSLPAIPSSSTKKVGNVPPTESSKGNPSPTNTATSQKAGRRKRKEKKIAIEINLWVNGVKYEFGLLCTFCGKIPAVCHCILCTDFYCEGCDITAHKTKKRKDHIRARLSKLDKNAAAKLITRAVRRYGHLRILQARCRQVIRRYFDKKTLNYYYFNSVYGTVSWNKPYCLRKLQLAPFLEPEYAASKIQNLYHLWRARERVRKELSAQYKKIFDRARGEFYYAYNGSSKLIPRSNWKKAHFYGNY
jgi:hypothetical protein